MSVVSGRDQRLGEPQGPAAAKEKKARVRATQTPSPVFVYGSGVRGLTLVFDSCRVNPEC